MAAADWAVIFEKLDESRGDVEAVSAKLDTDTAEMFEISELARFAEALREPELTTFSIG